MENAQEQPFKAQESPELTVFTVNIDGAVFRCPVSPAALYMLASATATQPDQIAAYLALKAGVQDAVARLLGQGLDLPAVFEPEHFLMQIAYADSGYTQ